MIQIKFLSTPCQVTLMNAVEHIWQVIISSGNSLVPPDNKPLLKPMLIQGAVSIRKTVLPGMAIPMLKIRRPNGRLIFNMEIAIRR